MATGYSGTPLARKLGYKAGTHAHRINARTPDALPHDTPRLRLRRLALQDLAPFQAYRSDAELGRYQGWLPLADSAALSFLQQMADSAFCPPGAWFQLGIARRDRDALMRIVETDR